MQIFIEHYFLYENYLDFTAPIKVFGSKFLYCISVCCGLKPRTFAKIYLHVFAY
jgi:hypothetical protein